MKYAEFCKKTVSYIYLYFIYLLICLNITLEVYNTDNYVENLLQFHYKRQWYAFLFTDNHDVLFDKRIIWFYSLYC